MDPNKAPGFDGARLNFSEAPGGDISFDDLFPSEEGNQPAEPQVSAPGTQPSAAPQAPPPPPDFYLKAGESVYKSAEDAAKGIEHKDSLIGRYRKFLSDNGLDPDTLSPARQTPPQEINYMSDGKRYYQDLVAAVQKGDEEAYARVQHKYVNDAIAPAIPFITEVARQKAVREVTSEVPGFTSFIDTPQYKEVLDGIPLLKQAISVAENDLNQSANLNQLYKIAYLTAQGRNLSQAPPAAPAAQPTPSPAGRTMTTSTMTPPPPGPGTSDWATNREARKSLIRDMESRGVQDVKF